ncbi:hypothetical protein CEXT_88841 [Caerostris extrusa]|uniref:Uncharacterized protein n=1 Tax=Caerostris extrusa TaxID=172846 RepID=A0AAV4XZG3_CAEEX|nr:hypothetical protein CEXT_88841 [Caerostris extrusa]
MMYFSQVDEGHQWHPEDHRRQRQSVGEPGHLEPEEGAKRGRRQSTSVSCATALESGASKACWSSQLPTVWHMSACLIMDCEHVIMGVQYSYAVIAVTIKAYFRSSEYGVNLFDVVNFVENYALQRRINALKPESRLMQYWPNALYNLHLT